MTVFAITFYILFAITFHLLNFHDSIYHLHFIYPSFMTVFVITLHFIYSNFHDSICHFIYPSFMTRICHNISITKFHNISTHQHVVNLHGGDCNKVSQHFNSYQQINTKHFVNWHGGDSNKVPLHFISQHRFHNISYRNINSQHFIMLQTVGPSIQQHSS